MILGIDPGLANIGWAVVKRISVTNEGLERREVELVANGCVQTKSDSESAKRLAKIYESIEVLVKKYEVKTVVLESLFFARNAKSAIKVSEAIGVIKLCGSKCGLEVMEYTPLQIKVSLVGYGQATKDQVEVMVRNFLGLDKPINPRHSSDAAAAALTHLFTNRELVG